MREIAFRAWDGKKMIQNVSVLNNLSHVCIIEEADFESMKAKCRILEIGLENLMQFTGLRDKNRREIYEGDILRQQKNKGTFFKVYFDCQDGQWKVRELDKDGWVGIDGLWRWAKVTEIIGNIYENPELLKGPSK